MVGLHIFSWSIAYLFTSSYIVYLFSISYISSIWFPAFTFLIIFSNLFSWILNLHNFIFYFYGYEYLKIWGSLQLATLIYPIYVILYTLFHVSSLYKNLLPVQLFLHNPHLSLLYCRFIKVPFWCSIFILLFMYKVNIVEFFLHFKL